VARPKPRTCLSRLRPRTYSINQKVCVDVMQTYILWVHTAIPKTKRSGSMSVVLVEAGLQERIQAAMATFQHGGTSSHRETDFIADT